MNKKQLYIKSEDSTITININQHQRIEIVSCCPFHDITICDLTLTLYEGDKKLIVIADDYCSEIFAILEYVFSKFLENKLELPESLSEDIAIVQSKYYHASTMENETEADKETYKLTNKYHAFEVRQDDYRADTWFYSKNEQLVLYVTPNYAWHFADPDESDPNYCTHEEFLKRFSPYCITYIEKEVAQECIPFFRNLEKYRERNCHERSKEFMKKQ